VCAAKEREHKSSLAAVTAAAAQTAARIEALEAALTQNTAEAERLTEVVNGLRDSAKSRLIVPGGGEAGAEAGTARRKDLKDILKKKKRESQLVCA
jgi:hypothetical protein